MFQQIAVFGLGLLGGSVCRGLKGKNPGTHIAAYGRSEAKLSPALRDGCVDSIGSIESASMRGVDLALVSTPVDTSIEIITRVLSDSNLGPDALVIDVGSVKEGVVRSIISHDRAAQFIGCHPMAGSEKMGYEHSRADLFNGASVIITPHAKNRESDIEVVRRFWESLDAVTAIVAPDEHDRIVAYTSHLPHMVAAAIVKVVDDFRLKGRIPSRMDIFLGSGFRDTTRIASGSPEMWRDISAQNRGNIISAIDRMIGEMVAIKGLMAEERSSSNAVHDYLEEAKRARDGLS